MTKKRPLAELVAYREKRKLSRRAMAEEIGVRPNTIWRWEAGEQRPDREYLPKLSQITGLSPAEIVGLAE